MPELSDTYEHADSRVCVWRRTWAGNQRDGRWLYGWWYWELRADGSGQGDYRWCADEHG